MPNGRLLSYLKKSRISRNVYCCHSLSFVVTRLTRCTTRCNSLLLVVPLVLTRCCSLSLDVSLVFLFINDPNTEPKMFLILPEFNENILSLILLYPAWLELCDNILVYFFLSSSLLFLQKRSIICDGSKQLWKAARQMPVTKFK